jgi:hypothetical protein
VTFAFRGDEGPDILSRKARRCETGFSPVGFEQRGRLRMRDHGRGRQDRTRIRKSLNAGGDVHCGPEVVLAVVEHDRQARPFVDADLEQQVRPSISRILASVRW